MERIIIKLQVQVIYRQKCLDMVGMGLKTK
jgi:hypothetical protein